MAEIVLIHGIAQEQQGPASLEAEWLPALSDGLTAARRPDLARRVWPIDHAGIEVRMAAYGDLFLPPGAMGDFTEFEDLDADARALAQVLAAEWLHNAADRAGGPDRDTAATEIGFLESDHEVMGPKEEVARSLMNAVARVRWFAPLGMGLAERFVNKSLSQVSRYLTDPGLRERILARVLDCIGSETKIIVGHSLGSVVAYEIAAASLTAPLPLLLTLGSPLGLRTIIYDRVQPQPPVYPANVRRWVNIADRNDLVAAEPNLTPLFPIPASASGSLSTGWIVNESVGNGPEPHNAQFYLRKRKVGTAIAEALTEP